MRLNISEKNVSQKIQNLKNFYSQICFIKCQNDVSKKLNEFVLRFLKPIYIYILSLESVGKLKEKKAKFKNAHCAIKIYKRKKN